MNAWLVTWEGTSASLNEANKIAALVSVKRSSRYVADYVENIYLLTTNTVSELSATLYKPSKRPYRAKIGDIINGVPHGDRIDCGHNPWLYARKVGELVVVEKVDEGVEIISWTEPPKFRWADHSKTNRVVDEPGVRRGLTRPIRSVLDGTPFRVLTA